MNEKHSKMMQHYEGIKEKYPDCVVFYRLGDFYEMFFEDAIKVSGLLDLTLTARDCGNNERAPMCGVPFHAADTYIAKLVSLGEKVAICEQLTDPKESKGLVERDVVRVISAGTLTDDSMLDESKNNYIACVYKNGDVFTIAWTDITTGEFFVGEYGVEDGIGQLVKLSVAEVIANDEAIAVTKNCREIKHGQLPPFSSYVPWAFNVKHAEKNLLEQFKTLSLAAYNIAAKENCISAAGALLEYLKETQKRILENISTIKYVDQEEFLSVDSIAVRNLELIKNNADGKKYGSLLWLLDKTKTSMGARLLSRMVLSPLRSIEKINYRQDGVAELVASSVARMSITETLRSIKDIERLAGKLSNGNFNPIDCIALASSLRALPSLKFQLAGFTSKLIRDVDEGIPDLSALAELLFKAIEEKPPVQM
ncbi:MAG: DNA mismatch repair protein MutS, partial [Clostridia bacterium]|nr:DNA mismatch repair protein MutS [Clostridia bacterium]